MKEKSDSTVQREIESFVRSELARVLQLELESKMFQLHGSSFQVDFYNKEKFIYGEIYCGINELKPGQTRKVLSDVLKLLTIEKMLGQKIEKIFVFVDEALRQEFNSKSWGSKAFQIFDVKTITIQLSKEQKEIINCAKKMQYR
jgi:hypothetical protein